MEVLQAMIRQLGCLSFFLTLLAADLYWDSLMRLFPNYDEGRAADRHQRVRLAWDNLRDNLYIVAYHFYRRLQIF
jgi:hypothetical protein